MATKKPAAKQMEPAEKGASREGKVYSRKSDASRAAKQDGLKDGEYEVREHKKDSPDFRDGDASGFKYVRKTEVANNLIEDGDDDFAGEEPTPAPAVTIKENPVVDQGSPVPTPVRRQLTPQEQYEADLEEIRKTKAAQVVQTEPKLVVEDKTVSTPAPVVMTPPGKPAVTAVKCAACGETFPDRPAFQKHAAEKHPRKQQKGSEAWLHQSQVQSPTKAVWHIADEMITVNPAVSRKEVIAECERRGIAHWTARTQYQTWLTARRESMANAAKANGNNGQKK